MTDATKRPPAQTHGEDFIRYLLSLADTDRGALAALRRSLSFEPGCHPGAFPYVERFVGPERHAQDPYRKALYLTAGLYARHPNHRTGQTLASALGRLWLQRDSASIEKRFIALLAADAESLPDHLRQAVSLLAADDIPLDYAKLLNDLGCWLTSYPDERLDDIRQRWARDFYRALTPSENADDTQDALNPISD